MDNDPLKQEQGDEVPFSKEHLKQLVNDPDRLEHMLEETFLSPLLKLSQSFQEAVKLKYTKKPQSLKQTEAPLSLIKPIVPTRVPDQKNVGTLQKSIDTVSVTPKPLPIEEVHETPFLVDPPQSPTEPTVLSTSIPLEQKTIVEQPLGLPKKAPAMSEKEPISKKEPVKEAANLTVKDASEAEKRFLERQKKIEDLLKKDKGTTF